MTVSIVTASEYGQEAHSKQSMYYLIQNLSHTFKQALEHLMGAVAADSMQQLALYILQWLAQPRQKLQGFFQQYQTAHLVGDAAGCIASRAEFCTSQCKVAANPALLHAMSDRPSMIMAWAHCKRAALPNLFRQHQVWDTACNLLQTWGLPGLC